MAGIAVTKRYSLAAVQFIFNGHRITGFEGDSVQYEYLTPQRTQSAVSTDGKRVSISSTPDPRLRATITLQEGSASYLRLFGFAQVQLESMDLGIAIPYLFLMVDPYNGDTVRDTDATFEELPVPNKGPMATQRQFKILLPNGAAVTNMIQGALNVR